MEDRGFIAIPGFRCQIVLLLIGLLRCSPLPLRAIEWVCSSPSGAGTGWTVAGKLTIRLAIFEIPSAALGVFLVIDLLYFYSRRSTSGLLPIFSLAIFHSRGVPFPHSSGALCLLDWPGAALNGSSYSRHLIHLVQLFSFAGRPRDNYDFYFLVMPHLSYWQLPFLS